MRSRELPRSKRTPAVLEPDLISDEDPVGLEKPLNIYQVFQGALPLSHMAFNICCSR